MKSPPVACSATPLKATFAVLAALLFSSSVHAGTLQVEVLDVGQGDAILLTLPAGERVLIDAGPTKDGVYRQLRGRGIRSLDLVVASHAHLDHIGGMEAVVESFKIGAYVDSGVPAESATFQDLERMLSSRKVERTRATTHQSWSWDEVTATVLWPGRTYLSDTRSDLNSNSVVLRVDHGDVCFLFTGDAEEPTEEVIADDLRGGCEVLKVAHHGSRHSTSSHFLDVMQPEIALISCGKDNKFDHPGTDTLERLERIGAEVFRTDQSGRLILESDGTDVVMTRGVSRRETLFGGRGG